MHGYAELFGGLSESLQAECCSASFSSFDQCSLALEFARWKNSSKISGLTSDYWSNQLWTLNIRICEFLLVGGLSLNDFFLPHFYKIRPFANQKVLLGDILRLPSISRRMAAL